MFDLFRNMDPEFREELSGIVEYLSVPQGEGPRVSVRMQILTMYLFH